MWVEWDGNLCGAPSIDTKRPYGNSDHTEDITYILGWSVFTDENGELHLSKEQYDKANTIHRETEMAMQIVLCTQSFRIGTYQKTDEYDDRSWIYIKS